ncbi:hypothetical protein TSAR_016425 [Trichomalopsis sarcophagae]|uniref:Uncharacterized protein n=1 Tax=Trichomalopsis sarcophagae TaxID=543379 RepID=A0A232EPX6_9HYME|nr:hypothetical protein TSAR_016425 [Trichomalopsis sarcophagae]
MRNKYDVSYQQQALMSFMTHDPVRYSTYSLELAKAPTQGGAYTERGSRDPWHLDAWRPGPRRLATVYALECYSART